jgi:hypothetical protein
MSKAAQLAALIGSGQAQGDKNLIINGAMTVAQRSTSETGVGGSSGYFTCDRWRIDTGNTAGRVTMSQASITDLTGFATALKLDVTTADTSIASGEVFRVGQRIEGQNLQQLAKGTASAKSLTLSFYVKGNAAATYVAQLKDVDNTRVNTQNFSVTTSWTRVELTYAADTTGTLDNNNANSLEVMFWLHAGSDFTSGTFASNTWASETNANNYAGSNTSIFDSTNRELFITGVSLEIGEVATPFEHESYGETLQKCHRYFQRHDNVSGVTLQCYNTTDAYTFIQYPDGRMRASATATVNYSSGDTIAVAGSGKTISAREFTGSNRPNGATFKVTASGLTAGYAAHYDKDASNIWQFDAEL